MKLKESASGKLLSNALPRKIESTLSRFDSRLQKKKSPQHSRPKAKK